MSLHPIMEHFAIWLIETCGLEEFKQLYTYSKDDVRIGFKEVYSKTLDEIVNEWKEYVRSI